MDYNDLQVRQGCTSCGDGGLPLNYLSNAADAESTGFEVELSAAPSSNIRLTAGVGYNDAQYGSFENVENRRTGAIEDASGNSVPLAAEWTMNASAEHDATIGGGILTSRLDINYIDERFSDRGVLNQADDLIPSQTLLNGRLTYRPDDSGLSVALWAKNLLDDDGFVYLGYSAAFGVATRAAQYQEPRTYGVSVDYSF